MFVAKERKWFKRSCNISLIYNNISIICNIMSLIQCPKCGAMVSDRATLCPKCNFPLNPSSLQSSPRQNAEQQPAYQQVGQYPQTYQPTTAEEPNVGLNIVSFFFPIVGWILWGVYKNKSPKQAKSYSKWAWYGFGAGFVVSFVFGFIAAFSY